MANTDKDLALALQLQDQLFTEDCGQTQNLQKNKKTLSLVDADWELTDPNPDIRALFLQFNEHFFWGRLAGIEVKWSPRMTSCAGICCYEGRGGLCSVRLSTPLLKLRPRKDLLETLLMYYNVMMLPMLLFVTVTGEMGVMQNNVAPDQPAHPHSLIRTVQHEMIHAYLFVTDNNKDHDGHGPEFHKHMYRINKATGTNITVYHTFHDEVALYKQHWWRCDGSCRSRKPYYGYVKRSMNRAPSKNDTWFAEHQRTCGGSFTKVKEPEGYGKKAEKKKDASQKTKDKEKSKEKDSKPGDRNVDIRIFGGAGKTLGSSKSENSLKNKQTGSKSKTGDISSYGKSTPTSTITSNTMDIVNKKNTSDTSTQKKPTNKPGDHRPTATVTNTHIPLPSLPRGINQPSVARGKASGSSTQTKNSFHLSDFSDSDDEILGSLSLDSPRYIADNKKQISSKTVDSNVNHEFTTNLNHTIDRVKTEDDTDVRAKLRQIWGEKKLGQNKLLPLSCKTDFSIANSIPLNRKRGLPDLDNNENAGKRHKQFDNKTRDQGVSSISKRKTAFTAGGDINENVPLSSLIKKPSDKTRLSDKQNITSSKFRKIVDSRDLNDAMPVINPSIPQSSNSKQRNIVTSPIDKMFNKIRANSSDSAVFENETSMQVNKPSEVFSNRVDVGGGRNIGSNVSEAQTSVCPVCNKKVPLQTINDHLDLCLTLSIL